MSTTVEITRHGITLAIDRIAEVCRKYDVTELAVFGSFLREDFRADSDIDFLVSFRTHDDGPWMGKLFDMQAELAAIVGREVELVERDSVEQSPNYIRRRHILSTAEPIYVEG
jgi:predicted nucleotidyltransferase